MKYCPKCKKLYDHYLNYEGIDYDFCDCGSLLSYKKEDLVCFFEAVRGLKEWKRMSKVMTNYYESLIDSGGIMRYEVPKDWTEYNCSQSIYRARTNLEDIGWIKVVKLKTFNYIIQYIKIDEEMIRRLVYKLSQESKNAKK